jgi:CubicO group peptidase (beta-lactamase class C family)
MEEKPGTPKAGGYAMGWGVTQFPWSERTFLTHGGSNGMNLAWITLLPEEDLGLVLLTNAGGSSADSAFRELSRAILEPMIAETKTQTPR